MADKKISQLTAVTTPLAGTEVLPIVQSGTTKKVTALELTGTTLDAFGNVIISNANLVIGTAGKGIDFSATSGAGTSELLDDYEEGTWTPSVSGAAITVFSAYYTKIGRVVSLFFDVVWPTTADTTNVDISGIPFSAIANSGTLSVGFTTYANLINGYIPSTTIKLYGLGGNPSAQLKNVNLSSFRVIASASYITT